ncbi:MAG TPA: 6-phosphogluconolactonase [Gemmatimonadota bacterium]|nr:6-phosphogluconolactonase [Gemmatimonadota bacterium]
MARAGLTRADVAVHDGIGSLAADAAERFVAAAEASGRSRFDVVLTGGSTAPAVYERLAGEPFASRVDWGRVHVWWTDERCVPPDDPRSNYRAAREALLDRVPIPCEQIHRMRGEDPNPEREAVLHEAALRTEQALARGEPPRFDFAFLGMGGDAHVASLFPGSPTLALADQLVAAVRKDDVAMPDPAVDRLTLTFSALDGVRAAVFMVAGEEKAAALRAVLEDPADAQLRPATRVHPAGGPAAWLVDRAAASLLSGAR